MILFVVAVFFGFFSLGANAVEGFVNYPSWKHVPEASFQAFHKRLDQLVPVWVVAPTMIWTIATGLLIFFGLEILPRWALITAFGLQLVGWVTSAAIDIPIQVSLSKDGWSSSKVERLIATDRWFRQLPALLACGLFVWMLITLLER